MDMYRREIKGTAMGYWRVKDGPQGFMLQGGRMQGSSGRISLCVFVYFAWEITRMRSGSDARTSSPVSPRLSEALATSD